MKLSERSSDRFPSEHLCDCCVCYRPGWIVRGAGRGYGSVCGVSVTRGAHSMVSSGCEGCQILRLRAAPMAAMAARPKAPGAGMPLSSKAIAL